MSELPPAAVLVAHRIADWDSWKKVFDADQPARVAAGALGHDVLRGVDDPDMVYVYCPAADVAKMRAFIASDDLAGTMKAAGVTGPPSIWMMQPMSADFIPDGLLPGLVVIHTVADYGNWRAAYDAFDGHRKQVGIVGHAVNRSLDDPDQVIVYHQARDVDTLRKFVESRELKDVMQNAGVTGAPEIHFAKSVDVAEY